MKKLLIITLLIISIPTIAQVQVRHLTALQSKLIDINKSTIGLGNVQNIAPADMPISNAVKAALQAKSDTIKLLFSQLAQLKAELALVKRTDTTYFKGFTGDGSKEFPFEDIEAIIVNPTNAVGEIKP